jgi:cytochrome c553
MRFIASMLLVAAMVSGSALAQNAPVADAAAGKKKTAMCAGCHGIPGWRMAYPEVYHVPKIHGQHQAYIVRSLQAYRSGERSNASMRAIAASLTDQDMVNLAAYYGSAAEPRQPVTPDSKNVSAAPGAPATTTK